MKNVFVLSVTAAFLFMSPKLGAQCVATFKFTNNGCGLVSFKPDTIKANWNYKWYFGDGDSSTMITPVHQYLAYGNGTAMFTVKLVVSKPAPNPCMSMTTQNITVQQVPDPSIVDKPANDFILCDMKKLVVANASTTPLTNTNYMIDWGDGTTPFQGASIPNNLSHTYVDYGTYTIVSTVTGMNGCKSVKNYPFFCSSSPTMTLGQPSVAVTCAPYELAYPIIGVQSNRPDTKYLFMVNDSTPSVLYTQATLPDTFFHTYKRSNCDFNLDRFTVTALAFNICDTIRIDLTAVRVDEPPTPNFKIEPKTENCIGETFNFVNQSQAGSYNSGGCQKAFISTWTISPNSNYTITAGSLTSNTGFSAQFSKGGTYTIRLTVENDGGTCDLKFIEKTICVIPKPTSTFTFPAITNCVPPAVTVSFTNTSNTTLPGYCGTAKYTWEPIFDSSPCGSTGGFTYIGGTNANSQNITLRFDKSGTYKIKLTVENICDKSTSEQTITISEGAKSIIDSIPSFCDGAKIIPRLKSTSSACGAAATGWVWSFPGGDPMNHTGETPPEITYNTPGTYTISVATTNGCGTTTATRSFTVYKSPTVPNITVSIVPPCQGKTITFSNPNPGTLTYKWSGPAGFTSTKPQPDPITPVTLANAGPYTVTVTDPVSNCTNTKVFNVVINSLPPVTLIPNSVCVGQSTALNATAGYSQYQWASSPANQFVPPTDKAKLTTTVFLNTSPVTYTVTVTDGNGCSNTASATVTPNPKPTVSIPALSKPPCASTNTTLIGIGLPAGGMGWWTSNTPNIISSAGVLNAPAGSYMVTFHYKAATGCEDSTKATICVINKPVAGFTASPTSGCVGAAGLTVTTTNTTIGKDDCIKPTYNWSVKFNGSECDPNSMGQWSPTNSTAEAPTFTFQKTGVYELTLSVTNDCGTTSTKTTITVAGPPLVDITPLPDLCKLPTNAIAPVAAVKSCYRDITQYNWQFTPNGTPTSSTQLSPGTVTYTTTGPQIVTFAVTNQCGTTTDRDTFNIVSLPTVAPTANKPCAGEALTINANATPAGGQYSWAGPGGPFPTTSSITINNAQAVNAGIYTVTYTVGGAGGGVPCTATATVTVVINPLPTVTVNPTATAYCTGGSATLDASGTDTYTWTPATGLSSTTGASVTANPTATTTYTVTGTATSTGCKNTATATVTVHTTIKPTITTATPIVACANTDKQLAAAPTTGGTGTWKSSSGSTITSTGLFKAPPGTYTVTYIFTTTTTPACKDSAKVDICVVSQPVADFTVDKTFACGSLTVNTMNKTAAATDCKAPEYIWTVKFNGAECEPGSQGQWAPTSSTDKDPVFIFSKQGKYDITLTVKNECGTSSKTLAVTVGGPPQVTIADLTDQCKQAVNTVTPTATIKSCDSPITGFLWNFSTAGNPSTSTQQVPGAVTYLSSGTYTITLTATNGCGTSTDTEDFSIKPLPTPTATANTPRCVGDKLDLSVTLPQGTYGYNWAGPAGFTSTLANPSRDPVQLTHDGIYTVTVTLAGCTATATVDVQVNPLPVATATAVPNPICYGQSTTLTAKPDGMTVYAWSPATELNGTATQSVVSTPVVAPPPTAAFARTYTVTVTDANGCKNTASATFNVNPLPKVSIVQPPLLCNQNIGQQLVFSPTTGGMGTWKGQHVSQTGVFTPTGLPGGAGDFPVTYIFKNSNGCIDSATVVVKVEDPVPIKMPKDTAVCINSGKFTLSATPAPGTWSGAPAAILNPATGEFTPSGDGMYTLTYTVGSGTCERKGTMKVTVWKLPVATATATPSPFCYGQSTTLTAGPNSMMTYAWSPATDLSDPIIQNPVSKPVVTPPFSRTYTVTVTDFNGCKNTASVTFAINPLPKVSITPPPLLCNQNIGQQLVFSPTTGGTGTWKGPISQTGVFTPTGLPGGAGDFPVTYIFKDQNGCTDSATVVVKVEDPVPIKMPADVSVCINSGKFTLSAMPTPGTWSSTPVAFLNPTTGEFTPSADGVFTLTYTVGSGTCERKGTMKVTVWKLPTIAVAGPPEICIGDKTDLTASGAATYIWSPATGLSATTGSSVEANPTTTQTYTVVGTDANGCNNVTTFALKVNPLPDVVAPDDIQMCNQPIVKDLSKLPKLTPLTGGTWSPLISPNFGLMADGKFTPTGTPSGLGTFDVVYTYTDPVTKCTDTDTMKVTVVAPQDITMPADRAVCINSGKFTLSAMPSGGTWSGSALVTSGGEFDPKTVGTYTLTYSIGEETCKKTATMVVIVNPLPVLQVAGDNKICFNDSTTITVTGNPANLATYAWAPANSGLSAYDKASVKASPAASTTYTVTVTDTNGCVSTATFSLTIDPLPKVEANDRSLCNQKIGEQLIGTPVPGPGQTGVWSGSPLVTATGLFTPTGQPGGTGTYTVTYTFTDQNGCEASDDALVTVDDPKTLKISKDTAVCINSPLLQLSAEPSGGSWSQLWSGGSSLSGDGRFNPTKDGTYRAVYTFGDKSCERKDTVVIIVNPLPVPAVGGDNKICFKDSTTITVTTNTPNIATYAWGVPNSGLSAYDKAVVKASPATSTTYTVTVTDTNGCANTATFSLTIDPLPMATAPAPITLCNQPIGEQLVGSPTTGGTGEWSGPHISKAGVFTPSGLGDFKVCYTFTDLNGCRDSACTIVTVKDPETLTLPKDTAVCINSGVLNLVAQPTGGTWSGSLLVTPGGAFDPSMANDYVLTYTYSSGTCKRTATMKIKVHPLPDVQVKGDNVLCFGDTTTLTASGAASYAWSPNTDISAVTGAVVKAWPTTSPFAYTVVGTDVNKCENSASINTLVNPLPMVSAGPLVTVCNQPIGEQLFGTPTMGGTGEWSGPHISKTGVFTATGTPAGLGNFTVCYTFTDLNGCIDSSCTVVTVEEPKTLVLPKDTAVCINSGVLMLMATPPGGNWTCAPEPTLVTPDGKFTPNPAGDYTLTYTFGSGTCLRTATMKITVNALPVPVTAGDMKICKNDSTTISVTPGNLSVYAWSPATGLSATDKAVVKASPAASTIYTVTVTDANGCTNTATFSLVIDPLPMASAGLPVTVCNQPIGEQLFGTPTANGTGLWYGPNISPTGVFTPNGLGDFTVCYTFADQNACKDTACTVVTVTEPATLVLPKDTAVCINSGVLMLMATPPGGKWSGSPQVTEDGKFTPNPAGDYTLTYTFGSGTCLRTATMKITVNALPTPEVASKTICFLESATLDVVPSNYVSYLWTPALNLNAVDTASVISTPTKQDTLNPYTQSYTVQVVDTNGCSNTATASVMVNPLPNVNAGNDQKYCDNPNPQDILLPSVYVNPKTGSGQWSGPGVTDGTKGIFRTEIAGGPGVYTLTYTYTLTATGCKNSDTIQVTVVAPIQAVVAPFDTTCYTSGLDTLTGTPAGGTWSGPGIVDAAKGIFDPKEAAKVKSTPPQTTYPLVYSYGFADCETKDTLAMLVVNYIGVVKAGDDFALCDSVPEFNLVGQPAGGYWEGPGITNSVNGTFYSAEAGPGMHTLVYFYDDPIADCKWSDTLIATVHPLPGAGFKKIEEGCITKPIQFENTTINAVKYYWTFGDGGFSEEENPQHAYTQVGTYTITLVATTDKGCQDSVKQTIIVAEPPYAAFTPSTNEGCAPLTVSFTNESSGYKISFFWDFGNGDTSTLQVPPPVTYQQGMHDTTYYVQLNVTNLCGTRYELDSILVHPQPVMQFGTDVNEGCSPLTVKFANISYGNPDSFIWDFGNGKIFYDSVPPPQTFFTDTVDKVYKIMLIGINECGRDTFTKFITVLPNHLDAFFNTDPTVGCQPLEVKFKNYSSGQNMVYNWVFGDKTPDSVEKDPVHTYNDAGVFKVILRVSNGCGYDTAFTNVTVYPQPTAVMAHLPKACEDAQVQFSNNSVGTLGSLWDFGDGETSVLKDPLHAFAKPGKYVVKLTVYAEITGCPATDSSVIEIAERPVAAFANPPDACVPAAVQMANLSTGADYYAWSFGNGTVSAQTNPLAIFKKDGTYQICLVAFDNEGCQSDPVCQPIVIHPKPKSLFSIENLDPCGLPLTVNLKNLSTGASGYEWNFGNNSGSTETDPAAVYSDSGLYKIILFVENQYKCRDTSAQPLRALYDPVADFTWSPDKGCQPLEVKFDTISGYFNQVWWDFGDGGKSNQFAPTHVYEDTGYYHVQLRVGSYGICFDMLTLDSIVRVYPTPDAKFSYSEPASPMPPDGTVFFMNESSKDAVLFTWAFGDGDSSMLENPTHRYFHNWVDNMIPLRDIATLWVENAYGCVDSFARPVTHIPIKGLFVPNAFSPENGPDEVRVFMPAGVGLKKYKLEIFSSWGELLWSSDRLAPDGRPAEPWDGMYQGRLMPQDVYVWKIEAEFEDGDNWDGMENRRGKVRRTGVVNLLR